MGCWWLIVAGGFFEVLGLGTVAWQVARLQVRVFGPPGWVRSLTQFLERTKSPQAKTIDAAVELDAAASIATSGGRVDLQVGEPSIEDRVARLERDRDRLARELDDAKGQIASAHLSATEIRSELERQRREAEEEQKEEARATVLSQLLGIGLFLFGAVLSVLGGTLNC